MNKSDRKEYNQFRVTFQEEQFQKWEAGLKSARAFFDKHRKLLLSADWSWGFSYNCEEITIRASGHWEEKENWEPKKVAGIFGKDGWKRVSDPGRCGSINWEKTVDGVKVIIGEAEQVKPTLIAEVKLS